MDKFEPFYLTNNKKSKVHVNKRLEQYILKEKKKVNSSLVVFWVIGTVV